MATTPHSALTGADLHEPKGAAAATAGQVYVADGAGSGDWTAFAAIPIGLVCPFGAGTAPSSWLLCYGQAISRVTYAALFAVLSTTHGIGDGSTTFNLPDIRGRAVFGDDNMGGSTAGRITNAISSVVGTTLGAVGGSESHLILQTHLPVVSLVSSSLTATESSHTHTYSGTTSSNGAHSHDVTGASNKNAESGSNSQNAQTASNTTSTDGAHTHTYSGTTAGTAATITMGGTVPLGGSGTALTILPPAIILSYIIYTGA